MAPTVERTAMSPEEFRLIRDLVYEHCGIFFHDDVKYLLERRLNPRLPVRQAATFSDYYRYLRFGAERRTELEQIVELLTTNETYFFREEYQLRAFVEEVLPDLVKRRALDRRLRIWSAGCSSGEEVYTIAILVRESPLLAGWNVEVFGNDISRRVLQIARKGIYGKSSHRVTPPDILRKYFKPLPDNRYQIDDSLRAMVGFGHLNLLDNEMVDLIGPVDVVFCRNVLIYFDKEARMKVIRTFHRKLRPGGYLLLGHSESLINVSTEFELVYLKNDMVYRKAEAVDWSEVRG
jgi:chemotaxis protein methyltransferase CheR